MSTIPLWAQLVIAILGSGTVGGIAGIIGGVISSSKAVTQRLTELEITRQQQMQVIYLLNARQFIDRRYSD